MSIDEKTAVFCMLARDCEKNLVKNIPIIEKYRSFFRESFVIVIENDSKDETNVILNEWSSNFRNVNIKHIDSTNFASLKRIERMVTCRNEYLNETKKLNFIPDYLILIDSDVELLQLELSKIMEEAPDDWGAIFANGRYYFEILGRKIPIAYYDLYAFLPYKSKDIELNNIEIMDNGKIVEKLIKKNKYSLCDSAFGGIGIYKYEYIKDSKYEAIPNNRSKVFSHLIDHLRVNQECSKHGNLYICKDMKLFYEKLSLKNLINTYIRLFFGYKFLMNLLNFYSKVIKRNKDIKDFY